MIIVVNNLTIPENFKGDLISIITDIVQGYNIDNTIRHFMFKKIKIINNSFLINGREFTIFK